MKVIIADDEIMVCQLIEFLVDWQSLGMKVVSTARNGVEALVAIEKYRPDIVITDIRMPGCNGLEMIEKAKDISSAIEFIIISGHRHFEYAQRAIKYGVKDYLLKPIQKEELVSTLTRMRHDYLERTEQLTKEEKLRLFEKKDIDRIRMEFFNDIIFQKKIKKSELTIAKVNHDFHFHFKEGLFQIVTIKIDGIHEGTSCDVEYIEEKIKQLLLLHLEEDIYEMECFFEECLCYIAFNFSDEKKSLRKNHKLLLDDLLLQKDIFENLEVTIGMGIACDDLREIDKTFRSAIWAMEQRLVAGTNRVIEGMQTSANALVESTLFYDFNKHLSNSLECQDIKGVVNAMEFLEDGLNSRIETTGHEVLHMAKEAMNLYFFTMRNNHFPMEQERQLFQVFNQEVLNYGSSREVFQYLTAVITGSFEKVLEDKKQADTKPIREAKQYIIEHYMEGISLEIVSDQVGFNPTYFSSLFKKETDNTFTEYLQKIRMNKAKELLKETKLSVSAVCEAVGYNDIKHFTKSFTKYTSLKPNEYRKLYS